MSTSFSNSITNRTFIKAKFIFEDYDKYILMDVNMKVALDDLKYSFQKILNIDMFAKRLVYFYNDIPLNPNKSLIEQEERANILKSYNMDDVKFFQYF